MNIVDILMFCVWEYLIFSILLGYITAVISLYSSRENMKAVFSGWFICLVLVPATVVTISLTTPILFLSRRGWYMLDVLWSREEDFEEYYDPRQHPMYWD